MAEFVRYRAKSRAEAVALVRKVLGYVLQDRGRGDFAEIALLPGAIALLSKIQLAYIEKARGGTDEAGIKWDPLKRETIAQRRIGAGDLAAIGIKGTTHNRVRGLLTPGEDRAWRRIFATRLAWLRAKGLAENDAKARAAQAAWAILKAQGAKTKLQVLGSRQVEIGRDSGTLFRSLTPGTEDPDQICEAEPGSFSVGSNVPHAIHFHKKRPLWPAGPLPATWNTAIAGAIGRGLLRALVMAAEEGL